MALVIRVVPGDSVVLVSGYIIYSILYQHLTMKLIQHLCNWVRGASFLNHPILLLADPLHIPYNATQLETMVVASDFVGNLNEGVPYCLLFILQ